MSEIGSSLGDLDRRDARALRAVLIGATAAAGRPDLRDGLDELVAAGADGGTPAGRRPASRRRDRSAAACRRSTECLLAWRPSSKRSSGGRHCATSFLASPLAMINEAFTARDIAWVVMKGPVVASLLCTPTSETAPTEISICSSTAGTSRRPRACSRSMGYRHSVHDWALAERTMAGEISLSDEHVSIDLHWHLHFSVEDRSPFAIAPETMIDRRRLVDVAGVHVPTFDAVDTLLTLAFQARAPTDTDSSG